MPRTKYQLTLAGNARHQEANRKRLILMLQRFERSSVRDARKAAKITASLMAVDTDTIAANRQPMKLLLWDTVNLENADIWRQMERLFGIDLSGTDDRRIALLNYIDGCRDDASCVESSAPAGKAALKEAETIGLSAADADTEEIDWTSEPKSERERALRAAIIAQIEAEGISNQFGGEWMVESSLRSLVKYDEEPASDLAAKITFWDEADDKKKAESKRNKNRKLLDEARRKVDLDPPKELPSNVIRFAPRAVGMPS